MTGTKSFWKLNGNVLLITFCWMTVRYNADMQVNVLKKRMRILSAVSFFNTLSITKQIWHLFLNGSRMPWFIISFLTVSQMEKGKSVKQEKRILITVSLLSRITAEP